MGCKKQQPQPVYQDETLILTPTESEQKNNQSVQNWDETSEVICVLFGYGFNSPDFYNDAEKRLETLFGLEEENGLIWPVVYPDDLKNRISNLYDLINERNIRGIIILGAPENTHMMLSRLQEFWDNDMPYPVFSLFPQDDPLGMEATCDFVLEYERTMQDEADTKEMEQIVDKNAEDILINAVKYILDLPPRTHLPYDQDLHTHVQNIVGDSPVRRYTDSQTGIQSINHFVMQAFREDAE